MSFDKIPAGNNIPHDFNVIIEIPMNADPIKYEVDKDSGAIFVDRFMMTAMHYPCNYGYIPKTLAADGDPVDVLVITPFPLHPGVVVRCRLARHTSSSICSAPHQTLARFQTGSPRRGALQTWKSPRPSPCYRQSQGPG